MKGLSERQYAARIGLSRGAIQKAKAAGRLVLNDDGSIDPDRSDALRADTTDVSKSRPAERTTRKRSTGMRPVPEAALSGVSETLKENGLAAPPSTGGTTFLQAKTAHGAHRARDCHRPGIYSALGRLLPPFLPRAAVCPRAVQ